MPSHFFKYQFIDEKLKDNSWEFYSYLRLHNTSQNVFFYNETP